MIKICYETKLQKYLKQNYKNSFKKTKDGNLMLCFDAF